MVIEEFERLSKLYDGKLYIDEKIVDIGSGARDFFYNIILHINYKNKTIRIKNTTGAPVGNVICDFGNQRDSLVFNMETRDIFISLFFKGSRFKFKKNTPNIDQFFHKSAAFQKLKEITKKTAFEPTISGLNQDNSYKLRFNYSLKFENWVQVIKPIILFYIEFIDEFN